ncbi:type VI secretion system protein ImpL [Rhodobacter aestuarii]|uniref:Type VI secretion system protein ImpL n=1 Tax=Rhodobacter aestuarii TaxID=453582 RepID=A0A1N7JWT4_9RHOB|nr:MULTISPECIES: type VI secretion system membrane subunit TssM [Rhodobacter]PTV95955.1 type VI secretion system protein ImpL [Rhodobacter aestuarii]SIS53793.1 type VI secretion system protein ImpL [Rhodobacter aestuarii]SOC10609.1 type VI secretion system protein ImpL [Rhodobacter sp. JA431]
MKLFGVKLPKAKGNPWISIPLTILGLAGLCAAIWFGLPMTGREDLSTVTFRAALIGGVLGLVVLIWLIRFILRRRAARRLEAAVVPSGPVGDGEVLSERMAEALETLKKSGGRNYLYDLPWYVIIGPPGAGKTTALMNSGIEFPLAGQEGGAVAGFGGTRYCDWWFAEDAILIDTAGRYTTQDSDASADSASWNAFLELLKKTRPEQPINGVLLAFSVEDMLNADEEARARHAEIVRARLAEIHEALKVDFPVYVLFTKCDLIAGFREFFSSFSLARRNSVWGCTFQSRERKALTHEAVPEEYDRLVARLSDEVIDRLTEEGDATARIAIFGLPGQMAMLREPVADFLRRVFEPTRYATNAILRGFYFTSGTQEGTPIDQVLGAVARAEGAVGGIAPGFMSGKGKSFFLHDLLTRVIFEERDWVSHDRGAVRRDRILRASAITAILLATVGLIAGFGISYWRNAALIAVAQAETDAYRRGAGDELRRDLIEDPALDGIVPILDDIRSMPTGYGVESKGGLLDGLGLGQLGRLSVAADSAYSDALERMLRPRLLLSVEQQLHELTDNADATGVYRALKVYLLLGGQGERNDDATIESWFAQEWTQAYPGPSQTDLRDRLRGHLAAMLKLDSGRNLLVDLDSELVSKARQAIVQLPVADQAYAVIMDGAAASGLRDWSLADRTGPAAKTVFTTRDGADLDSMTVPAAFTYEGFWGWFYPQLAEVADSLRKDQWVLGAEGQRPDFEAQLGRLDRTLMDRYRSDFKAAWDKVLGNLALNSLVADEPAYRTLGAAASASASPLLLLVREVDAETRLTREFEGLDGLTPAMMAPGAVVDSVQADMIERMRARSSGVQRILFDAVMGKGKGQARLTGGGGEDPIRAPIERIEEDFSMWHELLLGESGQRPIDAILGNLGAIWNNLRLAQADPQQTAAVQAELLNALTQNNSQLPTPMADLVNEAESDFRKGASDANLEAMNRALADRITYFCRDTIKASFPFSNSNRFLSIENFSKFFGPGGDMDKYFTEYLAPHVERTSDGLRWREDSPLADRLSLATLRQFERAERIRQAYFSGGGTAPSVEIAVTHVSSHATVKSAILMINDTRIETIPHEVPKTAVWPGNGKVTAVQLSPKIDGQNSLGFTGSSWTIIQFMNAAVAREKRGDTTRATFVVGGRDITYDFTINALTNPFTMPELKQFECPASLD